MVAIALDGPSGAGKSSVAKAVAKELNFIYVDTGALYRTVGLYFLNNNIDIDTCDMKNVLKEISVDIKFIDGVQHVFLNGSDVSDEIRTPKASMYASAVSAKPDVRAFLLDMQRDLARKNNVIMDGRDIGTVVLPEAKFKIFLTASDNERARRRFKELIDKGQDVTFNDVLEDMRKRDYNDSHRDIAPLKPAENSVTVDSTNMTFDEVVEKIVSIVKEN